MVERVVMEFCTETPELMRQIDNDIKGQNLLTIRKLLNEVRSDMAKSLSAIKDEALKAEIVERYFNVYDTACALYYSNAVDQQIFKTLFFNEIENLTKQELKEEDKARFPFVWKFISGK